MCLFLFFILLFSTLILILTVISVTGAMVGFLSCRTVNKSCLLHVWSVSGLSGINNSDYQWLNLWLLVIGVIPSRQRMHEGERTRMFILQLNRKMAHPASAGKCEEGVDFNEGELRDFMNYKTF